MRGNLKGEVATRTKGREVITNAAAHAHCGRGLMGNAHDGILGQVTILIADITIFDGRRDITIVWSGAACSADRPLHPPARQEALVQENGIQALIMGTIVRQAEGHPIHGLFKILIGAAVLHAMK